MVEVDELEKKIQDIFVAKVDVVGKIAAILDFTEENPEGLFELIAPFSRVVLPGEIHELMLIDEQSAEPGKPVYRALIIGFFQVKIGGIIILGDEVSIGNRVIGKIAGFGVTHMPNHMNIVIKVDNLVKPTLNLQDAVIFRKP